jgi:hypothetical protein
MRSRGTRGQPGRSVVDRLSAVEKRWTSGRRVLAPAGLIALIATVGTSALLASADAPPRKEAAAGHRTAPTYLQPLGTLLQGGALPDPALIGDHGTVGVPVRTPRAPIAPRPAVMARQAPAIAPYQGAAGTLTPVGIATLALEHGCSPEAATTATAIAMAESGGSPGAQGDIGLMTSVWDWSAGLWQIRGLRTERGTGALRDSIANQAVDHNAAAMRSISAGCADWTPWSTFNTGAYLQFMTLAQGAVQYAVDYFNTHGHYPPVPAPDPTATIPVQGSGAGPAGSGARGAQSAPSSRHPSRTPTATHTRAPGGGGGTPAPTASGRTSPPAPAPGGGGGGGGGGAGPGTSTPAPTTSVPKLPLPTSSLPKLPLPTSSLPKLPLPTISLPVLP